MARDPQSRKWQLTINNPADHDLGHDKIKALLGEFKSCVYYCLADEQGETCHTHIYIACSSATRFSTVKNYFQEAHIEAAKGSAQQNRDYITKSGKWENDDKHGTSIPGTFEEWGELPDEPGQGKRTDLDFLYQLIKEGMSTAEIVDEHPEFLFRIRDIDLARETMLEEEARRNRREVKVIYIWGATATGKTRYVMDKYGYENVYRVSDYKHPFDQYKGQDVLLFDEFRYQLKLSEMLNYLDCYPIALPCRYNNRAAQYTKVYIISNIDFISQYPDEWKNEIKSIEALKRRINRFVHFSSIQCREEYHVQGNRLFKIGPWDEDSPIQALPVDDTPPTPAEEFKIPTLPENAFPGIFSTSDTTESILKAFGATPVSIVPPVSDKGP